VHWTFGTVLWSTLVFAFWVMVIWMFIALFADVLRRDMSGWAKAGWIILMVILPFVGILAYVIARPRTDDRDLAFSPQPVRQGSAEFRPTEEIAKAAELREQGRITPAEYERIKQHALSY
jgi:phospholipase D-like protein